MRTALIRIDEGQGGAYAITLQVDDGEGAWAPEQVAGPAELVLPDDLDLDAARRLVLEEAGDSDEFRTLGQALHAALVGNPAGAAWHGLRAGGTPLRTLVDVEPADLRTVPWETLWDPDDQNWVLPDYVAPVSRVRHFDPAPGATEEWWPLLRVMVVVGIPDDEAAEELAGLHEGLAHVCGLVDVTIVRPRDEQELATAYTELKPHVLHFLGHGRPGELEFHRPGGQGDVWSWRSESIGTLMRGHHPRLVVLNACRSDAGSPPTPEQQQGVMAVAEAMSRRGVGAVVAMQGDVRNEAAGAFSAELWRRLAGGDDVDVAVAHARYRMSMAMDSWTRRDPWLPVLTLAVPPDRVLPTQYRLPEARETILRGTPGGQRIRRFVDRGRQRRLVWSDVVDAGTSPATDGIVVTGRGKLGKTAFAEWCVGACAVRGYAAAYVDLQNQTGNSLDMLATIAEELCRNEGDAEAVVAAFDAYIARVDELQGDAPPDAPAKPDEGRYRRTQHKDVSERAIEEFYIAFRKALAAIDDEHPILLALDNVPAGRDGHWGYFVRFLLGRLDEAGVVCVITAPDADAAAAILGPELAQRFSMLPLPPLARTEFGYLLRQLMRAVGYRRDDFGPFVTAFVQNLPEEPNCMFFDVALMTAKAHEWETEPVG